jgi:hypothetical protein
MQEDALLITPDFLSWTYYDTTTMRALLRLALLSLASPDGNVNISTRRFADSLSISHKELRTALSHLQQEGIISIQGTRLYSIVHIEKWHSLSHCFKTVQGLTEGTIGAHRGHTNPIENQPINPIEGHSKGTQGAQQGHTIPSGAQQGHTEGTMRAQQGHTQLNENQSINLTQGHTEDTLRAQKGHNKGTDNIPPTSPSPISSPAPPTIPTPPIPPSKKEKKGAFSKKFFDGIMERFNQAMTGKSVPRCTKMSDERCQAVRNFIADYSVADIDKLIQKAAASPRLTDGRSGKRITFDLLFNSRYYNGIMEGAWDSSLSADSGSAAAEEAEQQPKAKSWLEEAAAKARQKQQQKDDEERNRLQAMIQSLNGGSGEQHTINALKAKSANGTLARLGITWQPPDSPSMPAAEKEVTPSDLSYIQSILNRK